MLPLVFTIADVVASPQGAVIALADERLDSLPREELEHMLVGPVAIDEPSGTLRTQVSKIDFSTSLIGKKNVFLLLESSTANPAWIGCRLIKEGAG